MRQPFGKQCFAVLFPRDTPLGIEAFSGLKKLSKNLKSNHKPRMIDLTRDLSRIAFDAADFYRTLKSMKFFDIVDLIYASACRLITTVGSRSRRPFALQPVPVVMRIVRRSRR